MPPKLEDMMVGGSEAQAQLARMFVDQQPPHLIRPTQFRLVDPSKEGGHRRSLQLSNDKHIVVTLVTTASDPDTAKDAVTNFAHQMGASLSKTTHG